MNPKITWILIAIVVAGAAIYGGYIYPVADSTPPPASPTGSTFNNAKIASVNMAPQSISATSTSALYNGDSTDRIITDGFVTCSGLTNSFGATAGGLASLTFTAATSAVAAPTASIATRPFAAFQLTLATSTEKNTAATSTYTSTWGRVWNSGTYLIVQTNGTSSAEVCNAGVHYLAL